MPRPRSIFTRPSSTASTAATAIHQPGKLILTRIFRDIMSVSPVNSRFASRGCRAVKRDQFYGEIWNRLGQPLDPDVFERCVCDLLRAEHPSLVPVRGGGDSGMDGAIADGEGPAFPLICTTSSHVIGNLSKNLASYLKRDERGHPHFLGMKGAIQRRSRIWVACAYSCCLVRAWSRPSVRELA
jgi:hypothetical protein